MSRNRHRQTVLASTAGVVLGNTRAGRAASRGLDRLGRWALLLAAGVVVELYLHPVVAVLLGLLVVAGVAARLNGRGRVRGLPDGTGEDPRRPVLWEQAGMQPPSGWYEWFAPTDPTLLELCRNITGDQWWPGEKLYVGKANDLVQRWDDGHRADGRVFYLPGVTVQGHIVGSEAEAYAVEARILASAPGRYNIAGVRR